MLEPVLTLEAEMEVGACLAYLDEYPGFGRAVVCIGTDGVTAWFAFGVGELRWLLQDVDVHASLRVALELEDSEPSPTFAGALEELPEGFEGVVVAGDDAVGYSLVLEEAAIGTHRGGHDTLAPKSIQGGIAARPGGTRRETMIPVFFATDRAPSGKAGPHGLFGSHRGELSFGRIDVSIPPGHERGEIEVPKWWKLEFRADPDKHITLRSAAAFDESGFLAAMGAHFDETSERDALVFVHGYKVGFDDGIRRTAQIAHDLRFKGAPILYSWPSADRLLRYTQDETNARWTEAHFTRFLDLVLNRSGADAVHVIAHSMGNRVVAESLQALGPDVDTHRLQQVMLAAPDIDAATFETMAARFHDKARQFTLYASSRDLALLTSQQVHGYQRAGDSAPRLVIAEPVVTIDASRVDTNLLGHSYIGDSKSILADIHQLLESGAGPEQRHYFLEPAEQDGERYWVFVT